MLIQVNDVTWLRAEDIIKIYIDNLQCHDSCEYRASVNFVTRDNSFREHYASFNRAKFAAQQIADRINNAEKIHVEN